MDIFNNLGTGEPFLLVALLVVIIALFLYIVNKKSGSSNSEGDEKVAARICAELEEAKTVEEFTKILEGTTWHFTEPLEEFNEFFNTNLPFWLKFRFQNGSVTTYIAYPSDGKWTVLDQVEIRNVSSFERISWEVRLDKDDIMYIYVTSVLDKSLYILINRTIYIRYENPERVEVKSPDYKCIADLGDSNPWD